VPYNVRGEELGREERTHHPIISNPEADNLLLILAQSIY
jgi:hypothetical protein